MTGRVSRSWLIPVITAAVAIAAVAALSIASGSESVVVQRASDQADADSAAIASPSPTSSLPVAVTPPSSRPPLGDPPDPGPVPTDHGIAEVDLATAVSSSVRISGLACDGVSSEGAGFAVGESDLVATSAHVIVGMNEPNVDLADGRTLQGMLVAFDAVNDLAVLRVVGADLSPLPLRATVPDGTKGAVLAWDHEDGSDPAPAPSPFLIDRPIRVRTSIVAGTEKIERRSWLIAARVKPGHSGAALLVSSGGGEAEVVGVAWGTSRRSLRGVGYATRSDELARLIAAADLTSPLEPPSCS